mgnify:CR=1 FL=1
MLAAERVLNIMRGGAGPEQQAQGCAGIAMLAEKEGSRAEVIGMGAIDVVVGGRRAQLLCRGRLSLLSAAARRCPCGPSSRTRTAAASTAAALWRFV